jgi:hypothetical protein
MASKNKMDKGKHWRCGNFFLKTISYIKGVSFFSSKERHELKEELKKQVENEICYCCKSKLKIKNIRHEGDRCYIKCDICKSDNWIK